MSQRLKTGDAAEQSGCNVVTFEERDMCTSLLSGDNTCYLPNIRRINKDKQDVDGNYRLIVEGIEGDDLFSDTLSTIFRSADSVMMFSSKSRQTSSVLLTYCYKDRALDMSEAIKALLPSVKVHENCEENYKDFSALIAEENHYLTPLTEAKKLQSETSTKPIGILINHLPSSVTGSQLAVCFPTSYRCWTPGQWVDGMEQHRYGFVEYHNQEQVDKALAEQGNELEIDGSIAVCLNYGELSDALNTDVEEPMESQSLSDKSREYLIKFIKIQLNALCFIHDVLMRAKATLECMTARQRKDMTHRRKTTCRLIHRCMMAVTKDKERRWKADLPIPDTSEQTDIIKTAYAEAKKVVGKEMFDGCLTKKPPPQTKKHMIPPSALSNTAAKYHKSDVLDKDYNEGFVSCPRRPKTSGSYREYDRSGPQSTHHGNRRDINYGDSRDVSYRGENNFNAPVGNYVSSAYRHIQGVQQYGAFSTSDEPSYNRDRSAHSYDSYGDNAGFRLPSQSSEPENESANTAKMVLDMKKQLKDMTDLLHSVTNK